MMIFTDRDLESLSSLKANWERLYRDELARLLNEADNADDPSVRSLSGVLAIPCAKAAFETRGQNDVYRITTTKHN
jgi:hypothetical protein